MLQQTYAHRLDANMLKLIAILAMTADHLAWLLFPGYSTVPIALFLHVIGRLTCPIMCYFIAEGYHYTRSVRRYAARLFIFAFISHFAYIFASGDYVDAWSFVPFSRGSFFNQTGVMWSLAWGLVMLCINDTERLQTWAKTLLVLLICLVAFPADWSCIASLCVLSIGANRGNARRQIAWCVFYVSIYAAVYALALDPLYGLLQLCAVLSVPLLGLYNGRRGADPKLNRIMKWGFYVYYPLHLTIIGLLREFVL